MPEWTNEAAIAQWETLPPEVVGAMDADGDFAKRHLVNPHLLRLLGADGGLTGRRILDAGCGNGYFSRMLAREGAHVVGVEPTDALSGYARRRETELAQGIRYLQAGLTDLPADFGAPFDAVVCSMVLMAIPDWKPAMRACVEALRPGGTFVFAITHPAFEGLGGIWREHGAYRVDRYLADYDMPSTYATDFHRPLSAYLNELAALGCRLREVVEPGLPPELADADGLEAYVRLPNFLIAAAEGPA
ncbi:class I SAM-dependent methyltransferase [Phytomonospora sp. NPDC050363]|uniref:class I SAM-dependent methyltransferase n=1 Tax=Phytomonospora sp. NPDC050363 TaxID=3155642 RepID=UPI00340DCEAF